MTGRVMLIHWLKRMGGKKQKLTGNKAPKNPEIKILLIRKDFNHFFIYRH